ncbi:20513_t:CDS:2 [Cetraspora pellucida]|uniref:20513_t:CDS:1 n=1 Tax=Cetraspora pellucida TaxID=1433469 RepID=A0A9N9NU70_9GLOM|nr:20513_t:CDS:2 [Cetraspora pellucida]
MCIQEHKAVVALLQKYLNVLNSDVIINPPILVSGQLFHPSPNADGLMIAPDIAVYLDETYVSRSSNPRPLNFETSLSGSQPNGCNALGNPAYQINIPISDVFYDPPIPAIGYVLLVSCSAIPGSNFIIDLYEI